MAKRFKDTLRWDKSWYRKLTPKQKCLWEYLTDRCDQAGVWEIDFELASFYIGEEVTLKDLVAFDGRVIPFKNDKYRIIGFIFFQNGVLSTTCKAHNPIFKLLAKHGFEPEYPAIEPNDQDVFEGKEIERMKPTKIKKDKVIISGPDKTPVISLPDNEVMEVEYEEDVLPVKSKIQISAQEAIPTKEEVFDAIFSNEKYMDGIRKIAFGKNVNEAFEECWLYHSATEFPPAAVWIWKQKFISWLSIKKKENVTPKNNKQVTGGLINSFNERHGSVA